MPTISVSADAVIEARPALLLEIIRDFRTHHPHILPPAFSDFRVVEGGYGDGSVLAFTTTLGGRAIPGTSVVREPAPGIMEEHIVGRDMVTTFRVVPNVAGAHVAIDTRWTPARGIAGIVERLFVPRLLRSVYAQELELLAGYAASLEAWAPAFGALAVPATSR